MKSLNLIYTTAFADCIIDEFDAPNLTSITVDEQNVTFTIRKKNFQDISGIL